MTSLALCTGSLFCKMRATVGSSGGFSVRQVKRLPRALILEAPSCRVRDFFFIHVR